MKKLLLLTTLCILLQSTNAQSCGNSGPGQCTVSGVVFQPGLTPLSDSLPPFINNQPSTTVIQFKNFDVVYFGSSAFTLQWLRIDSIENLPSGLCWASDRANNTYLNSENGCVRVSGTPCDSTGEYRLRIIATALTTSGFQATVNASAVGLDYYVRLKNLNDPTIPTDTNQIVPFFPYGGTCLATTINLGADQTVCPGSNVVFHPTITNGQAPYYYSWLSVGDTLSCDTCQNPEATITQSSRFIVMVTDGNNHVAWDSVDYAVTGGGGNFRISSGGSPSICVGSSVTLYAGHNNSFTTQWQRNGADIAGATDTAYVVSDSSGNYSVLYNSSGCQANSNIISISVNDVPTGSVTPSAPVDTCQGFSILLQASSTLPVDYLWQRNGVSLGGATNPTYSAVLGGTYSVIVTTPANCSDTSNAVVVTINPAPNVTLDVNLDTLCTGSTPVALNGSPAGGTYNGTGISGTSFDPILAGTGSHNISYSYTDGIGCSKTVNQTIVVRLCSGIGDTEDENFLKIYPNPANSQVTIQSDLIGESQVNFELLNITGQLIIVPFHQSSHQINFNINSLAEGLYWVKVNLGGKTFNRKFIKID